MNTISESFLRSLIARLEDENTIGFTLIGSHARGEAGRYSDLDLRQYVSTLPDEDVQVHSLFYENDTLVSVFRLKLEDEYASLKIPRKAIWAIPGLTQARILLDKDGSIAALTAAAGKVDWRDLQPAADDHASDALCGFSEEVHKVLDGLDQKNEGKVIYATWGLSEGLATVLLTQRGVLLPTENVFIDHAQRTAGMDSNWSRYFRRTIGADLPTAGEPAYVGCGIAALGLYRESCALMQAVIRPDDGVVIQRTLGAILQAGY